MGFVTGKERQGRNNHLWASGKTPGQGRQSPNMLFPLCMKLMLVSDMAAARTMLVAAETDKLGSPRPYPDEPWRWLPFALDRTARLSTALLSSRLALVGRGMNLARSRA